MSPAKREGMLVGAAAGALFSGAAACGTAAASNNSSALGIACPIGIAGGAIIGGTIGYFTAYSQSLEGTPPAPPPPVMAQQSSAPAGAATEQPAAPPPPPIGPAQAPLPTPSGTPTSTPAPTSAPTLAAPSATPSPMQQIPTPTPQPPAATPLPSLSPPTVVAPSAVPVPAERIVLRGVLFRKNSWALGESQMRTLDFAVETLKAHPNVRIYVKGYSDSRGSAQLNEKLSQERAATVAAYLAGRGIPLSQLVVRGMGSTHPLASNDTAAGRAMNRRVELEPILEDR